MNKNKKTAKSVEVHSIQPLVKEMKIGLGEHC